MGPLGAYSQGTQWLSPAGRGLRTINGWRDAAAAGVGAAFGFAQDLAIQVSWVNGFRKGTRDKQI